MIEVDWKQLELNPFEAIGSDTFLITAGDKENWNTMTAGWGGMGFMWGRPAVFVFIRESRYTLDFVNGNDKFSLSFLGPEGKDALKVCGTKSGRDIDKAKEAGITPMEMDGTISFEEANMVLTCTKASCHLISKEGIKESSTVERWYPEGNWHYMFVGLVDKVFIKED